MRSRILIIVVVFVILWVAGCRPPDRHRGSGTQSEGVKPSETQTPKSTLKTEFRQAHLTWDDEKTGKRLWDAKFKEASVSASDQKAVAELEDVKATLYKNGKVVSTLMAPRVQADSRTKEVRASGGVIITSTLDRGTARCNELTWKSLEDKIVGTGAVKIVKRNLTVDAKSFESDTALKHVTLTNASMEMK